MPRVEVQIRIVNDTAGDEISRASFSVGHEIIDVLARTFNEDQLPRYLAEILRSHFVHHSIVVSNPELRRAISAAHVSQRTHHRDLQRRAARRAQQDPAHNSIGPIGEPLINLDFATLERQVLNESQGLRFNNPNSSIAEHIQRANEHQRRAQLIREARMREEWSERDVLAGRSRRLDQDQVFRQEIQGRFPDENERQEQDEMRPRPTRSQPRDRRAVLNPHDVAKSTEDKSTVPTRYNRKPVI